MKHQLPSSDLTPLEKKVLDYILDKNNWEMPRVKTIAKNLKISSPMVSEYKRKLRKKHYL